MPPHGTLGALAYGWRGVVAWRTARGSTWREEMRRVHGGAPDADPATLEADPEALDGATVVVVSGLPRTGTSMMMQMLVAGGLAPFTDGERPADDSNPRGYYEHARVRGLARDQAWVPHADGQVVKVVAPLLPFLPPGPRYRVVFMQRPLSEVLASQETMLERLGQGAGAADVLEKVYRRRLDAATAWIAETPRTDAVTVDYGDAVAHPADVAARVAAFLGGLDAQAMAAAVDPSLHRHR